MGGAAGAAAEKADAVAADAAVAAAELATYMEAAACDVRWDVLAACLGYCGPWLCVQVVTTRLPTGCRDGPFSTACVLWLATHHCSHLFISLLVSTNTPHKFTQSPQISAAARTVRMRCGLVSRSVRSLAFLQAEEVAEQLLDRDDGEASLRRAAEEWCRGLAERAASAARALGLDAALSEDSHQWLSAQHAAGEGRGSQAHGGSGVRGAASRGAAQRGEPQLPRGAGPAAAHAGDALRLLSDMRAVGEAHGRARRAWLCLQVGGPWGAVPLFGAEHVFLQYAVGGGH
jgi:hypothetical protein